MSWSSLVNEIRYTQEIIQKSRRSKEKIEKKTLHWRTLLWDYRWRRSEFLQRFIQDLAGQFKLIIKILRCPEHHLICG